MNAGPGKADEELVEMEVYKPRSAPPYIECAVPIHHTPQVSRVTLRKAGIKCLRSLSDSISILPISLLS